ncbi:MAG: hypothetical protein IJ717_02925 [Treponema sp.]|nr:hypothetical protein [Treponema sp.]
MKLSKKILAAVSIVALAAFVMLPLASCSDDGDSGGQSTQQPSSTDNGEGDGEKTGGEGEGEKAGGEGEKTGGEGDETGGDNGDTTPHATLPESVGANPFAGKTWEMSYISDGRGNSECWKFSDTTATWRHEYYSDGELFADNYVYNYSYNADENLLYLSFQSAFGTDDGGEWSYASLEDFKKTCEEYGYSSVATEMELEWAEQEFSTLEIKKYTIDGDSLKLEDYFDGSLPTLCEFEKEFTEDELPYEDSSNSYGHVGLDEVLLLDETGHETGHYYRYYPTFKNGSFSGTAYDFNGDEMTAVKLGTISGTYTTSGSGTAESGCTVTLNFTSIPSGIPVIVTGKDYVLEMSSGHSDRIYTLVSE